METVSSKTDSIVDEPQDPDESINPTRQEGDRPKPTSSIRQSNPDTPQGHQVLVVGFVGPSTETVSGRRNQPAVYDFL